jgi:signal peptidase I
MRRYEEYTIEFDETPAPRTKWNVIYEILDSFSLAVLLVMVLFAFLCRPFWVSGSSMEPTLQDRNWVAVTTAGFYAQRGDIVVVSQPNARHEPLIKRIIAVAGDTVEIDPQAHTVSVNGDILDEPYISEPVEKSGDLTYPIQVPEGHVFVMGDNRNDSLDSRSSMIGFIDTRYLSGKAVFRFFPVGQWRIG